MDVSRVCFYPEADKGHLLEEEMHHAAHREQLQPPMGRCARAPAATAGDTPGTLLVCRDFGVANPGFFLFSQAGFLGSVGLLRGFSRQL